MLVECGRCGAMTPTEDIYHHRGKDLCEDCYMGAMQAPKTCDVAAVHMAKKHRQGSGQSGTEGLLEIQRKIYEFVKANGRATRDQIMAEFNIPDWELDKQVAVLRHCELIKGRKEADGIYLVLFETE